MDKVDKRPYTHDMAPTAATPSQTRMPTGSTPQDELYLTVRQVADELGITPAGVYKLKARGKLPAVMLSERGMRFTRWALDAYKRRYVQKLLPDTTLPDTGTDRAAECALFKEQTGRTPEAWVAAWKRGTIEDTAENGHVLVRAVALRDQPENPPKKRPKAVVARGS